MNPQDRSPKQEERTLSEADLRLLMRLLAEKPKWWQAWRKGHFKCAMGDVGHDSIQAVKNLFQDLSAEICRYFKTQYTNYKERKLCGKK